MVGSCKMKLSSHLKKEENWFSFSVFQSLPGGQSYSNSFEVRRGAEPGLQQEDNVFFYKNYLKIKMLQKAKITV